jgi:hypothetical protein
MFIVLLVAETISHGRQAHQRVSRPSFFARPATFFVATVITHRPRPQRTQADQDVTFRVPLASQLLWHNAMWKRALRTVSAHVPASNVPWYRRADVWLLLGAIVLPFGWILALGRLAWVAATGRRAR